MTEILTVPDTRTTNMTGRSRIHRLRALIRDKKNKPCMDCKETFPYEQMSYDHVRGHKEFNLGGSLRGLTEDDVVKEMAKCDVVCLNCHAERERLRRQRK